MCVLRQRYFEFACGYIYDHDFQLRFVRRLTDDVFLSLVRREMLIRKRRASFLTLLPVVINYFPRDSVEAPSATTAPQHPPLWAEKHAWMVTCHDRNHGPTKFSAESHARGPSWIMISGWLVAVAFIVLCDYSLDERLICSAPFPCCVSVISFSGCAAGRHTPDGV